MKTLCLKLLIFTILASALVACAKKNSEDSATTNGCTVADCTNPADLTVTTLTIPGFTGGGLATDGTSVYAGSTVLRKINPLTLDSNIIAGTGASGYAEGTGTNAAFGIMSGATVTRGTLFFTDSDYHVLRKISLETLTTGLVAGVPSGRGSKDYDGTSARMDGPSSVTLHGDAKFVVDRANVAIRFMYTNSTAMYTFAGALGAQGTTDGLGTAARFGLPESVVRVGPDLYVSDSVNQNIRKIRIATRRVSTFAGATGEAGFTDGVGTSAKFNRPGKMTTDGKNLYLIEWDNYAIRRINLKTGQVTTLLGGEQLYVDGPGDQARTAYPADILYLDNALYFTDEQIDGGSIVKRLRVIR